MSASEKLKAMEPEGLVETDEPNLGYTDAFCLSIAAYSAVVAVVEAAETWDRVWTESYDSNWEETRAALAALDEALK